MMRAEQIKKVLVVDEEKLHEELLQRVKNHLLLDKTGRVHLKSGRYRDQDRVALYLIGKRYACDAKLVNSDTATIQEISTHTGLPRRIVNARLNDLRSMGWVESPQRGISRIVFARAGDILDEIDKVVSRRRGD